MKIYKGMLFVLLLIFILSFAGVSATDINQNNTNPQQLSSLNDNIDDEGNENIILKDSKTVSMDSTNFDEYVSNGKFNEKISDGDTIDITGKLDSTRFSLEVDKSVNIISTNGKGYIDFHTQGGKDNTHLFKISKSGSGSNITGLTFHNTRVSIENTSNIVINNISCINENTAIGQEVGSFTVREGSENITVTNSYFKAKDNGGHSNVVFAAAYNCLFENNTVENYGNNALVGNTLYLTTYNVNQANPKTNINITIRNNIIRSNITMNMATCWGLVLEGKGHLIENNYIAAASAIVSQYADSDYDFETVIDGITVRNNYIEYGSPQFNFPGEVYNNTINGYGATFGYVKAYNNTVNKAFIKDYTIFENNTAKSINITGNNNVLNNNEVYSDDEYAVTVTGENNTLENNKLVGYLGRGENAISNSTEITSVNNSEDINGVFYINDENFDKYFEYVTKMKDYESTYTFKNGDMVYVDITVPELSDMIYFGTPSRTESITVISHSLTVQSMGKLTLINTTSFTGGRILSSGKELNLINSIISDISSSPTISAVNSIILGSNYQLLPENSYLLWVKTFNTGRSLQSSGYLLDSILNDSTLLIGLSPTNYLDDIYIDRKINITGLPTAGFLNNPMIFLEGSKQTTVNGVTFYGKVTVNDEYIRFTNCTFNGDVEVNNGYVSFEDNVFNGNLTLNQANFVTLRNNNITLEEPINITSTRFMEIENNMITTTSDSTILFDEESNSNTVKNNILTANTLLGDDSVVGGDNIVEDNYPSYNTSIEIVSDDLLFKNDKSNVTVTVYNLLNNTPVDKGYVEIYLDGVLKAIKTLNNGQVTLEINTDKSSLGTVLLKVWYYDGIRYANKVSSINVEVVKSDVSITVDEFTAKLNEKATITATFLNGNDNPVQDNNVTFSIGRSSFTVETVDGVATLDEVVTKEWLDAGKLTVSFPNTDVYNSNTTSIALNTSKADVLVTPMVSVDGNVADVELTLSDALGENVTDGRIVLSTLDGQELASGRVSNGKFSSNVALPEGYSDEYLVANFTGSYYYNDFVRNVKISQMLNSTVSLETNSPLYGEELVITGRLVDSKNNPINDEEVTVNTDGLKTTYTTDANGTFTHTYTPVLGVNNITVTFNGNSDVYGTSVEKSITIRDTDREMNDVLNKLDELQDENDALRERLAALMEQLAALEEQNNKTQAQLDNITQANNDLKDQLDNITQANNDLKDQLDNITQANNDLKDQLDNQTANLTEQNDALQEQLNNLTQQNKDLQEQLKALEEQNNATQEQNNELNDKLDSLVDLINQLNAPKDTVLTLDELGDAKFGDGITISGILVDVGGNGVAGTVKLTVNGGRATVTSDASGAFSYDYVVTKMGVNNISAVYQGTDKYNPSNTTVTVTVLEQDTNIVFDVVESIKSGESAIIMGQLVDANNNGIYGTVKLTINNGRATVKTDNDGFFKYEATLSKVGVNNLTASYLASAKYNACDATTTVEVMAMDTSIVLDDIAPAKSGETITITGKLVDANNNPVVGTIKLLINSGRATVKTDNDGVFSYETALSKVGINNITVSYLGANRYAASEATTTVEVTAMDTVLTLESISDAKKGETITITGKLTDANDNPVVGTVKLLINGGRATVKTDENGVFSYDYTVTKVGTNNITATYLGANRYAASDATTTATVNRAGSQITLNPISTVTQKTNVDITGQLSDENGNGIYGTVKLLINSGRATVKTDNTGAFTYTYNATRAGDNTVTASYLESTNYEASETTTTFTVEKA